MLFCVDLLCDHWTRERGETHTGWQGLEFSRFAMSDFSLFFGPQGYPFSSSAQWPEPSFYKRSLARAGLGKCGEAAGGAAMWQLKSSLLVKSDLGSGKLRSTRQSCYDMKTSLDSLLLTIKVQWPSQGDGWMDRRHQRGSAAEARRRA